MLTRYKIALLALCAFLPMLMGPTSGFPSRPRFASVAVTGTCTVASSRCNTIATGDFWAVVCVFGVRCPLRIIDIMVNSVATSADVAFGTPGRHCFRGCFTAFRIRATLNPWLV